MDSRWTVCRPAFGACISSSNDFHLTTNVLFYCKYADIAQQAFSSDAGTTLHLAVPALEALHKAWSSRAGRLKYSRFAPALEAAADKIDEYYEKTTESPAYVMTMGSSV
jgi:hypothetical protein